MVVHGYRAIEEYLKRTRVRGTLLLSRRDGRREALEALARGRGVPVRLVPPEELDRLAGGSRHRGAVLLLESPPPDRGRDLEGILAGLTGATALVLFLDEITDPHNLGAILRSADQFAAELVLAPARGSARSTATVSRVSAGASAHVPLLVVPNLVRVMERCQERGFWIYGADPSGEPLDRVDLKGRVGLVLGSEGRGLRRLVAERCDRLVAIPAAGAVQSFNVSVAAGILMYEIRRQQGFPYMSPGRNAG
jgi:23S rRNA (guanosine2251-2'-O)-methyltransferase